MGSARLDCLPLSRLFQALHLSIPVVSFHPELRGRDQTEVSSDKLSFNHSSSCSQMIGACSCEGEQEERKEDCAGSGTLRYLCVYCDCLRSTNNGLFEAVANQLCTDILSATGRGMHRLRPVLVEQIFSHVNKRSCFFFPELV